MVILIVYLILEGFASVFAFIYANILLFHWVYFASFFDHYIEQNSCSKSVLNELKYARKSVKRLVFTGYRSATLLKLNFLTGIFERF